MDPYIGKMLDNRYELLERIGTGGMAVVYKAKCHRLNRLVAVKILKSDLAQDEDFHRRFNAESQAVAQLSHPNIVSVYDVSRGGEAEYIVMELIDGITLKQYMAKRGQLNWRESLHFITQILRGLSHAHSRGIVHRDIKPQNIMILRDGSVRVTDFGIACLENSAQTLTQEALGSVHYISPEQAKGDRTDARSDIYSAGVVLYEMLSGRLPFEGDSAVSVAIQHLSSIPLAPREINADIPEQLELICMKAMAPDLEKRYQSAEDMIYDLEAFRKNPGVNLDFSLEDLRPEVTDEPTRPLRTAAVTAASAAQKRRSEHRRNDERDDGPVRSSWKQTVLITVLAILSLAVVAVLFRSFLGSFEDDAPVQYVVPSVVGLTLEEAQQKEDVLNIFTIQEAGSMFSEEYPAGLIAKQDPKDGEYRKGDNRTINVWISSGEDTGEMLDVTNLSVAQAKSNLRSLISKYDLVIDSSEEVFDDEITAGYIVSTVPAVGEPLRKGETIYMTVSKGPELKQFPMPLFVGQNINKVQEQLQTTWKLTCTPNDIEMVDSNEDAGVILWQSIENTTMVTEWDTVKFRVSSGLAASQKKINIPLPLDGRDTVMVEVYVGDETTPQVQELAACTDGYIRVTLTGSGTKYVRVYFDGVLDTEQSHDLEFS